MSLARSLQKQRGLRLNLTNVAEASSVRFPYDISFPDSETSPATITRIEEYLARLDRHYDRITSCQVVVRIPHRHGAKLFHVHIQLDVPGKRLAVSRDAEENDRHIEIHAAIKDAFEKITRQLEDFISLRKDHKPY